MKLYISILCILSTICVVALHANGVYWTHPSGRLWITSSFIESVCYFAVPVFFMISGTTLMEFRDRYNEYVYFKKRIFRTVFPFLIWSSIAFFLHLPKISELSIASFVSSVINFKYIQIYWFFPSLFACYFLIPFISEIKSKKILFQLFLVLFVFSSCTPFLLKLLSLEVRWASFYIGNVLFIYVIAGYLCSKYTFNRWQLYLIGLLGLIGVGAHFFSQLLSPPNPAPIDRLFKGYANWPTVLYSVAVFVLVKCLCEHYQDRIPPKIVSYLHSIAPSMFGIYLIHIYPIKYIRTMSPMIGNSIWFRTLIFFLCLAIVRFVRKTPFRFLFP